MASSAQVARFQSASKSLVALAERELRDFWDTIDPYGNPIPVRDSMLGLFPDLVTSYGDVAAVLGADFYDELRGESNATSRFRAVIATPPPIEQAQAATRWGLGDIFKADPAPDVAIENLVGSLQRLIMQASRSTVIDSAKRDPRRSGFARQPQGPTCKWCIMLASRGFVYASEASAGAFNDWHDKCDCVVIPGGSPDDLPEDFDLTLYESLYSEGVGIPAP